MDTCSPALAEAIHLLQQDLYHHIEEAEQLAEEDWSEEQSELARLLLSDLGSVVRGMIAAHTADGRDCPTCGIPWPCSVFSTIHRLVKHPDHHFVELMRISERWST
jgi:hypothetical protein